MQRWDLFGPMGLIGSLSPPRGRFAPASVIRRSERPEGASASPEFRTPVVEAVTAASALARGPELLSALEYLAFRLDGRRDDELGLLQFADAHRAHRPHAGADGPDEVQRPVLGEGRAEEDLI